jgi:NADH-quinone oxidoreductase subunit C
MIQGRFRMELNYLYKIFNNIFFKNLCAFNYLFNFFYIKRGFYNNVFIKRSCISDTINFLNLSSLYNFKVGVDLTCVDFYYKAQRFKLNINLLSIFYQKRLFVNTSLREKAETVGSLSYIFPSFCWAEREVWDMFGIFFLNNTNLRRILTDYGFKGYHLRKDFPLTGFVELFFSTSFSEIFYRPVQLSQELRFFNFSSTWTDDSIISDNI